MKTNIDRFRKIKNRICDRVVSQPDTGGCLRGTALTNETMMKGYWVQQAVLFSSTLRLCLLGFYIRQFDLRKLNGIIQRQRSSLAWDSNVASTIGRLAGVHVTMCTRGNVCLPLSSFP